MSNRLARWIVSVAALACMVAAGMPLLTRVARGDAPGASVDQLKADAFRSLRSGQFQKMSELLEQAAAQGHDASIVQMAGWTDAMAKEAATFDAERQKEFTSQIDDVHKLQAHQLDDDAVHELALAYVRAPDPAAFGKEPWVVDLVNEAAASAARYNANEQWLKAQGLYEDLSLLQPADPQWKDQLKLVTRRIGAIALYTPEVARGLVDSEVKDRQAAQAILHPATQPADAVAGATTAPSATTQPQTAADTWKDSLRGVNIDTVESALDDANEYYYRDTTFSSLIQGGISGLRIIATTHGLDEAFPGLADAAKRTRFITALDDAVTAAKTMGNGREIDLHDMLGRLESANSQTIQIPAEVFAAEFASGALGTLDPFSTMIWPHDVAGFTKLTKGTFGGVGIQIQSDDDGSLRVITPLEDSPADRSGIAPDDIITRINGKSAKGISIDEAVNTISGKPGEAVTLTIQSPNGMVKDHTIVREEIKVQSVKGYTHLANGGWNFYVDPQEKIAYVHLTSFTSTSFDEMSRALTDLNHSGARGIILDLRNNPGGLLQAAAQICNQFIKDGVIVSTHPDRETPNQPQEMDARAERVECSLPMVILVNQYSASASEIVSGCLKDHHRALIVGERTFGKGSVQNLYSLDNNEAELKLTTAHYYLPSGRCIHREENSTTWGVDPDITVPMTPDQMKTAILARQTMDVLRHGPSTQPAQDLLGVDSQLAAGLLVLRLEVSDQSALAALTAVSAQPAQP